MRAGYNWYAKATEEQRQAHRERNNREYHRRKAAGLCGTAGCSRELAPGMGRCRHHLDMIREARRAC